MTLACLLLGRVSCVGRGLFLVSQALAALWLGFRRPNLRSAWHSVVRRSSADGIRKVCIPRRSMSSSCFRRVGRRMVAISFVLRAYAPEALELGMERLRSGSLVGPRPSKRRCGEECRHAFLHISNGQRGKGFACNAEARCKEEGQRRVARTLARGRRSGDGARSRCMGHVVGRHQLVKWQLLGAAQTATRLFAMGRGAAPQEGELGYHPASPRSSHERREAAINSREVRRIIAPSHRRRKTSWHL